MSKLVLYFPDGSTRDILLAKERTTIGRRPDNDVPLPSPAVSAEHAAIITVLDDSFLEDLGSTNGTFVNEKPVTKHFLRDRDRIDVGREILIYYTDDATAPDVLPADVFHHDTSNLLGPLDAHLAALEDLTKGRGRRGGADGTSPRPIVAEFDPQSIGPMTGQVATVFDPQTQTQAEADTETTMRVRARRDPIPLANSVDLATADASSEAAALAPTPSSGLVARVVDGPNAGRVIALDKPQTLVGRVGLEVVALRRNGDAVELVPVEGAAAASTLSASSAPRLLRAGDTFSVSGTTLQIAAD